MPGHRPCPQTSSPDRTRCTSWRRSESRRTGGLGRSAGTCSAPPRSRSSPWCSALRPLLQPRALPAPFLLHQLVQKLMSKGVMRYLVADLGGLFAVARGHRENFPVDRVGPRVSSAIDLDVDKVARHGEAHLP